MAGPGPYAVRSSAAAEDLPGASYAGMYESYLDVPGGDLPSAIIGCFGSADAAAGVAFTANPLTGARDDTVISAVKGLGESLVGGWERGVVGAEWTGQPQEWCCCRAARFCTDEAKRDGGRRLGRQRRPALRLPAGRGVGDGLFRAGPGPAGASDDSRFGTGGVAGPGKGRLAPELPAR